MAEPILIPGFTGINTRQPVDSGPFQPGKTQRGAPLPIALAQCRNALVSDGGGLSPAPSAVAVAGTAGTLSLHAGACGLLAQRGGAIYLHGEADPLVEGVSLLAPVQWLEHQGMAYWTDGQARGRITAAGMALPWALPQAPTPTLTAVAGALPAGRYLASVTWVDVSGAESGCGPSAEIELDGAQSIRVAIGAVPTDAVSVRTYVSPPNGQHPAWVADFNPAGFPFTYATAHSQTGAKPQIPLRTQGLDPLPAGGGMTSRGGFLVSWTGNLLWFSMGAWSHLCDLGRNLIAFPSAILGAVGVDGGLWVVTEHDVYWVGGDDPAKASLTPVFDLRTYARGGVRLAKEYAPGVQSARAVAAFVSDEGLVFGTADGQLVAPMRESQKWGVAGKRALIAPFERDGAHYLAVGIV